MWARRSSLETSRTSRLLSTSLVPSFTAATEVGAAGSAKTLLQKRHEYLGTRNLALAVTNMLLSVNLEEMLRCMRYKKTWGVYPPPLKTEHASRGRRHFETNSGHLAVDERNIYCETETSDLVSVYTSYKVLSVLDFLF
uniref:Putative secreted protein n=1 Tax=Ixodes ricinus TaxID=34613 RepID=A0A6B0USS3_IXORI